MDDAPALVVHAVEPGLRPVRLRLPFRFGASTLTACPQLFVRVDVEVQGHGRATGWAAEMMVPKWFDKRTAFSPADNVRHLAGAIRNAALAYRDDAPASAHVLYARHHQALMRQGSDQGMTALSTAFGQAVIDRAVIDALCRALGRSFFDAARSNLLGLCDTPATPELHGWDWSAWLAQLEPLRRIEARHTVGLLDELDTLRHGADGLPVSLPAVIERYGLRCFKIKLGGDPEADLARLRAVLNVLGRQTGGDYRYTLDGNEQYADVQALRELQRGLAALSGSLKAPLYVEQPVPRELSFDAPLPTPDGAAPLLMDEADGTLDAFVRGREVGWTGVSSKACKGVYKALVNRARCARWNRDAGGPPRYFMSAEDLTCQAGLAVQQDLALAALLGLGHSERNGHHYVDGMAASPAEEQRAMAAAHPDLYESSAGHPRLRIEQGQIRIDSLFQPGYAHSADPVWEGPQGLQALDACASML